MKFYRDPDLELYANKVSSVLDSWDEKIKGINHFRSGHPTAEPERVRAIIEDLNDNGIEIAQNLVFNLRPWLSSIEAKVGTKDEVYLSLSDRVAALTSGIISMGMVKTRLFLMAQDLKSDRVALEYSRRSISEATKLYSIILSLHLTSSVRSRLNLELVKISEAERAVQPNSGCFIATSIYGDYDSLEVLKLRVFRDEKLGRSILGKFIIRLYYYLSPKIIKFVENSLLTKNVLRFLFDFICSRLK
jgi:hypothetical protein